MCACYADGKKKKTERLKISFSLINQMKRYLTRWSIQWGPAFLTFIGAMKWADWKYEQLLQEEWD